MHEGEKINKRLCKFFIEIFELTDEQLAAIDYQIPMTQEIYDSVLDRCMELGCKFQSIGASIPELAVHLF